MLIDAFRSYLQAISCNTSLDGSSTDDWIYCLLPGGGSGQVIVTVTVLGVKADPADLVYLPAALPNITATSAIPTQDSDTALVTIQVRI